MRILGVIDLAGGRAVLARAGKRDLYLPVRQVGGRAIDPGDAVAVAAAYHADFGIDELYVADLDAITTGRPQATLITTLAPITSLWLDAGVTSVATARQAIACGATHVVVGLETLDSFATLARIVEAVGRGRTAFSLDLHDGRPLHRPGTLAPDTPVQTIAAMASRAGADRLIAIDLARVGTGQGLDLTLLRQLREAVPDMPVIAGGGIRGADDVEQLAAIGCEGALVASALHDGRLTSDDLARLRRIQPSASR